MSDINVHAIVEATDWKIEYGFFDTNIDVETLQAEINLFKNICTETPSDEYPEDFTIEDFVRYASNKGMKIEHIPESIVEF